MIEPLPTPRRRRPIAGFASRIDRIPAQHGTDEHGSDEPGGARRPSGSCAFGRPARAVAGTGVRARAGRTRYLLPWLRLVASWTRVTVLELPGWRYGRARSCPPTVVGIGTAVGDWLQATGRRDVVLVGHSTGAQAVLRAAVGYRSLVAGVVLAGPTFTPAARTVSGLLRALAVTLPRERPGARRGAAELPAQWRAADAAAGPLGHGRSDGGADRRASDAVAGADRPGRPAGRPGLGRLLAEIGSGSCAVLPGAHNFCYSHPAPAAEQLRATVGKWRAREGTG